MRLTYLTYFCIYMLQCVWTALLMSYLCHKFLMHCTQSFIKIKVDFLHYAANPLPNPNHTSYKLRMSYTKIRKLKIKVVQHTDRHKIKCCSFPGAPPCGCREIKILPETTNTNTSLISFGQNLNRSSHI